MLKSQALHLSVPYLDRNLVVLLLVGSIPIESGPISEVLKDISSISPIVIAVSLSMFAKGLPAKLGLGRIGREFSVPGKVGFAFLDSFITSLVVLED